MILAEPELSEPSRRIYECFRFLFAYLLLDHGFVPKRARRPSPLRKTPLKIRTPRHGHFAGKRRDTGPGSTLSLNTSMVP